MACDTMSKGISAVLICEAMPGVENQPHPVILRAVVQRVADMQQRVALFDGQRQLNRADGQLLRRFFCEKS